MKLFDWFKPGDRKVAPAPMPPDPSVQEVPPQPAFSDVIAQIHKDDGDDLQAASQHVADLEQQVDELEDELSRAYGTVERLKAELQRARTQVAVAKQPGTEAKDETLNSSTAIGQLNEIAHRGDPVAQFYIGVSYLVGLGNKRNSFLGEQWLTKSANSGDANAQFVLGMLKWHGIFLERGVHQALHWLSLAAKNQHQEADKLIIEVQAVVKTLKEERRRASEAGQTAEPKKPSWHRAHTKWQSLDVEINPPHINRTRESSFCPEDQYYGIQRDAYALGRRIGRRCLKRAVRFNRLIPLLVDGFEPRDLKGLARRFARRRGYLQHSITEGMEELRISEDQITSDLRDVFIKGVTRGIERTRTHNRSQSAAS
ncbi:hypothetical protein [Mesorhizobium sp. URHB0026]